MYYSFIVVCYHVAWEDFAASWSQANLNRDINATSYYAVLLCRPQNLKFNQGNIQLITIQTYNLSCTNFTFFCCRERISKFFYIFRFVFLYVWFTPKQNWNGSFRPHYCYLRGRPSVVYVASQMFGWHHIVCSSVALKKYEKSFLLMPAI